MSATYGPCPRCERETMYDDREPTMCSQCKREGAAVKRAIRAASLDLQSRPVANRKARRAAKKKVRG